GGAACLLAQMAKLPWPTENSFARHQSFFKLVPFHCRRFPVCGRPNDDASRMEIRKLPFFRPTISNLPRFSAPPLLEVRNGLPPVSSAISVARFRASSVILAVVPRTRTVSARCSPGFRGEESASRSSPTNVTENGGD